MQVIKGNFWTYWDCKSDRKNAFCITTNGIVNVDGYLIMGKGMALKAKQEVPELPAVWGTLVSLYGNQPYLHTQPQYPYNIISFPTKHDWRNDSISSLIFKSAETIKRIANIHNLKTIYSSWPGCGNGNLKKEDIQNQLAAIWNDDRFVIIEQ